MTRIIGEIGEKLLELEQVVIGGGAQSAKTQILGSGEDIKRRVTDADQVRAQLQAEIIRRKQGIDQQIQEVRRQRQQEIPKYVSGKPGEAKTQEEKMDLWQKQQKEAEEKKKEESLTAAVKQFQGSKEVGKFAVG